jgi:hypothetical protein
MSIAIADGLVSCENPNDKERENLDRTRAMWSTNSGTSPPGIKEILHWFHPNYVEDKTRYTHCYPALARLAVYKMALSRNHQALGGFLSHISDYGADVQLSALESISHAWRHAGKFSELCKAQHSQMNSKVSEIRTATYTNLTELLEGSSRRTSHLDDKETVRALLSMLPSFSSSAFAEQALAGEQELCARIKIGAWLFAAASHSSSDIDMTAFEKDNFKFWSHCVTWGSASSNVSLRPFFSDVKHD